MERRDRPLRWLGELAVDLSAYAGQRVEVSISYVSDWATQGIGVFLDDITVSTEAGTESFETGLGAWTVAGPRRAARSTATTGPEPLTSATKRARC